jgi:hypothetical protein
VSDTNYSLTKLDLLAIPVECRVGGDVAAHPDGVFKHLQRARDFFSRRLLAVFSRHAGHQHDLPALFFLREFGVRHLLSSRGLAE